jgi:predicted nucleotidyltransferase
VTHQDLAQPLIDNKSPLGGTCGYHLEHDPVLAEIVQRLVTVFHPERIYLFGSTARREAGPDSDYDLMVVLSAADEPGYRLAQRAHGLLWGLGTATDILDWTREQFDSRQYVCASLPATILREGQLLYAG